MSAARRALEDHQDTHWHCAHSLALRWRAAPVQVCPGPHTVPVLVREVLGLRQAEGALRGAAAAEDGEPSKSARTFGRQRVRTGKKGG